MLYVMKHGVYVHNGVEHEFNYKDSLSASEKIQFVGAVVDTIVSDFYYDVARNLIFDFEIIRSFTDIDVSDIAKDKNSLDKIEEFLANNNVVEILKEAISNSLLIELGKSIDYNIQMRTGIKVNSFEDALISFLAMLEEKIKKANVKDLMNDYFKSDDYKKHVADLQSKPDINFADNLLRVVKAAKE